MERRNGPNLISEVFLNSRPWFALAALLVLSACGATSVPAPQPPTSESASQAAAVSSSSQVELSAPVVAPTGSSPAPAQPSQSATVSSKPSASPKKGQVTKLLVIIEENHSLDQMTKQMPYLNGLAKQFAYADHYTAIRHPSLPNYLAITGGDTFGVTDDSKPSRHVISGRSVFGEALATDLTAKVYQESMLTNCALTGNADKGYAVKHNPWAYYVDERTACRTFDVPGSSFISDAQANRLPNAGLLVPNLCNDAHDEKLGGCDLGTADRYLSSALPVVLKSSDFTSGNLAVVITADEDDTSSRNTDGGLVLTVVLQAGLDGSHLVVKTPLTHYSLSRLYSEVVGAAPLNRAAKAPDMAKAFNLKVG
jgi:hypothetical protein